MEPRCSCGSAWSAAGEANEGGDGTHMGGAQEGDRTVSTEDRSSREPAEKTDPAAAAAAAAIVPAAAGAAESAAPASPTAEAAAAEASAAAESAAVRAAPVTTAAAHLSASEVVSANATAPQKTAGRVTVDDAIMTARNVNVFYGDKHAIKDVSLDIARNEVIAMIGPSGCGKSTFLRCLNRMNDTIESARVQGEIALEGSDIYDKRQDVVQLRARVGIVFQKPNPFPKSIFENVAYGPRIHGLAAGRVELDDLVQKSLRRAGLWEEVKDRLQAPGTGLSGGQQQRLCIARTIAVDPEVILMDEPCSALDPIASAKIEDLIDELRENYAIVIVTHNMQQAARVSQRTAYFHLGNLIEVGATNKIFTNPSQRLTEDYITGRFG